MPTSEQVREHIAAYLEPRADKRRAFGEVFTPESVIDRMLDALPASVWKRKDARWFDPTAGVGNIMAHVFLRLRRYFSESHIIKNMLWFCELDARNVRAIRRLFGADANVHKGDYLDYKPLHMFDVIVGNPPFGALTAKIVEKSFLDCMPNGHVVMVTPDSLFSQPSGELCRRVRDVWFDDEIEEAFAGNIQQPMAIFYAHGLTKLTRVHTTTTFDVSLCAKAVNPVRNWTPATERLARRWLQNEPNKVVYNRGWPLAKYSERAGKWPVLYTPERRLYTSNRELAVGLGQPKAVVYLMSPELEFDMDWSGRVGCGPNTAYVPFESQAEGKRIERVLNSDEYRTLAFATRTTRQFMKLAFLMHFRFDNSRTKTRRRQRTQK